MKLPQIEFLATLAMLTQSRSFEYDEEAQERNKQRLIRERKQAKELAQRKTANNKRKRK